MKIKTQNMFIFIYSTFDFPQKCVITYKCLTYKRTSKTNVTKEKLGNEIVIYYMLYLCMCIDILISYRSYI